MKINRVVIGLAISLVSPVSMAGSSFVQNVGEIQVLSDRVRMYVGITYGTCGAYEGWWGWSTDNPRHKDWLSLALSAQAQGKKIVVIDDQSSCAGPGGDTIGLEGFAIKP